MDQISWSVSNTAPATLRPFGVQRRCLTVNILHCQHFSYGIKLMVQISHVVRATLLLHHWRPRQFLRPTFFLPTLLYHLWVFSFCCGKVYPWFVWWPDAKMPPTNSLLPGNDFLPNCTVVGLRDQWSQLKWQCILLGAGSERLQSFWVSSCWAALSDHFPSAKHVAMSGRLLGVYGEPSMARNGGLWPHAREKGRPASNHMHGN